MNRSLISLFAISLFSNPQDEYFSKQWYLRNEGFSIRRDISEISSYPVMGKPGADIQFPSEVDDYSSGPRRTVVVAILDTGVDIGHPELKDSILKSSECDSVGNIPPKASPDRDGNGYKGDCAGYNFASNTSIDGDNQVYDDTGHGTHLAGLISAKANSIGIRGISHAIKILPVKIFNKYENPNHPLRPKMKMMDRILKGLDYAISKNVDVINLSLGWPSVLDSPKIRALFELAKKKNILIVAAAGNNAHHTTIFPCSYSSVLCVGASSVDGKTAPFSNFGGNVDLMAPGENILSTIPKKITPIYFDEDGYDFKNGTSQAAPLVAGSAALLKLALGDLPVNELKARILSSAARNDLEGQKQFSLYGDIHLNDALNTKPDSFIYPNLKELNTVEVGYPDGSFTVEMKFEKWVPSYDISAKIKLAVNEVELNQSEFDLHFTNGEEEKTLLVKGHIRNFQASASQVMRLDLDYGSHHYSFEKELIFALNANQVGRRVKFPEKINISSLRSVDDPMHFSIRNFHYTHDQNAKSHVLVFYEMMDERVERSFSFSRNPSWKFIALSFVQVNTIAVEWYDPETKKIFYEFYDVANGFALKTLEMVPEVVLFSLSQSVYWEGPQLRAVSFASGKIPLADRNPSVFIGQQNGDGDHLYYFEENSGKINTRILDHLKFRKELIRRFQLRYDDAIFPVSLLSKGKTSAIDALFAIGKGFQRRLLKIRFTSRDEFEVLREYQVPGAGALKNVVFLNRSMIVLQERKNAYQLFDLDTGKFREFEWNDRNDDLLGPVVRLSENRLLAQTQNHFVVLGDPKLGSIPLKRFSFLPGELFSEMFSPVQVTFDSGPQPGLFIDGTLISEQHLGVVSWNGQSIVKPVFFQEKLPEGCRVMNPIRIGGEDHLLLLCQDDGGLPFFLKRTLTFKNLNR